MKRIILLVVLLLTWPVMVCALGLGQIKLESGLDQPFEARITLLDPTASSLSNLNVSLADEDAFQRAGVERLSVLSKLKFEVKENKSGSAYIRVYSTAAIREPYLDFLVEADWSKGRLYREYTVLLDPPLYNPNARSPVVTAPRVSEQQPASTPTPVEKASTSPAQQETTTETGTASNTPSSPSSSGTPGEYGPTVATDTLWHIASTTRPDESVSVQQMMLAMLKANPDAFLDNNINGLKRGQILRIPNRNEILALTQAEALAQARTQNSAWQESHGITASTTPTRPVEASKETTTAAAPAKASSKGGKSELRLVAASEKGTGTNQGDTGTGAKQGKTANDLALANEQVVSLTQENKDLKDRLTQSDSVIKDLKRMISLKDDQLAALQNQIDKAGKKKSGQQQATQATPAGAPTATEKTPAVQTGEKQAPTTAEKPAAKPAKPRKAPVRTVVQAPAEGAAPGILASVIGMLKDNLVIAAGAGGGLLVIIIGFIFVSRRRQKGQVEEDIEPLDEALAASQAAAFAGSEDETVLPGDQVEEDESEAVTSLPDGAVETIEEEVQVEEAPEPEEPAAPPPEEPEEDPLAEVNVFLAYEHFDQAEEFVRDAISGNPDNLDFHAKLLEVFYASGDKAKYEAAAKVLHDKVDGTGPHWDMAVAMWSEMSPGRALFEAGGAEEETAAEPESASGGGGVLDLTAGESDEAAGDATDMSLDFDLGDTTDVPPAKTDEEDLLDVTAAVSMDDIGNTGQSEDLLDVTRAVGLDTDLDTGDDEEEVLDITAGAEEPAEDLLDVSLQSGDDLLDITAQSDVESLAADEEDLLDVTAASSAGADSDELLEIGDGEKAAEEDENLLDFNIGGEEESEPMLEIPTSDADGEDGLALDIGGAETEAGTDDNVIDFDAAASGGDEAGELSLDLPGEADEGAAGLDFDVGQGMEADSGETDLSLSLDEGTSDADEETMELSIDDLQAGLEGDESGEAADAGLELNLESDEDAGEEPSLELVTGDEDDSGVELDLTLDEASAGSGLELETDTATEADEADMEATVKMPDLDMDLSIGDDDDSTVFVPRSDGQEKSEEDDIATKLDLAKAYVELGDKDSAKGILEEIIRDGNPQQQETAQELLKQVS